MAEVLAENIKTLMAHAPEAYRAPKAFAAFTGMPRATIERIVRGDISTVALVTLDRWARLAAAFGLQAWQLHVEHLDPARPPQLVEEVFSGRIMAGLLLWLGMPRSPRRLNQSGGDYLE